MSSIRVTRGGDVFRLPCNDTDTLLALLRRAGCTLPAACGGHGRCGKCRVSVNGVPRLACRVVPEDGDEIVLPPAAGGRILTETLDPPAVPTGETGCAAAIDLGTTTTALRLYDLATGHALATCADWTALAPYGADVITRIQYTIDHQDGLTRLSSLLRQQLKALLTRALSQAGRQPAELKRTVTAGNTVMQSLLAGVSVRPLAAAPFCPETFFRQSSGLTLLDAPLYCVPCAAGFVGGDITAGLLASGLARRAGHFLFLDIGTNGEMALGGAVITPPAPQHTNELPAATEKLPFPLPVDVSWHTVVDLTGDAEETLTAALDSGETVLALRIASWDDVQALADYQYMLTKPVCFVCDDTQLLEAALRAYQGRALYDGDLPEDTLLPLCAKYGLLL